LVSPDEKVVETGWQRNPGRSAKPQGQAPPAADFCADQIPTELSRRSANMVLFGAGDACGRIKNNQLKESDLQRRQNRSELMGSSHPVAGSRLNASKESRMSILPPNPLLPDRPLPAPSVPALNARALMQGKSVALIQLDDFVYTLRITKAGKLILTK
jgi:hemin uptake protein HemP